ncbi:nicotinate mononucleotide-dependent phosphoribosyltransferase CobT [Natronomonas sp. EA1]|uniref:nicotinate mononucleotide-dependent phosphoribosyltransferase CobT n=1 Tax=Natronomonas sp. EA1 TaxID=3421655 RepID=UPI003EBCF149
MKLVLVAGATETAAIDGISAAGAAPELMAHTPAADAELVAYGEPVFAPFVPVSPDGCPTPAMVTRAVRECVDFAFVVADAGMAARTAVPAIRLGDRPGGDIREAAPVPNARALFDRAKAVGASLPDDELLLAESVPGGTTTALGVLRALGEPHGVSSSLPENPVSLKEEVVAEGMAESGIEPGGLADDPIAAVRELGDPTLAATAGLLAGARSRGARVTLAGGTQQVAAAAVARRLGVDGEFEIATTSFVAADETVAIREAAADLGVTLHVTDPGFQPGEHVATDHYLAGVAKEGVGMGGALWYAEREGVPMERIRARLFERYTALVGDDGP